MNWIKELINNDRIFEFFNNQEDMCRYEVGKFYKHPKLNKIVVVRCIENEFTPKLLFFENPRGVYRKKNIPISKPLDNIKQIVDINQTKLLKEYIKTFQRNYNKNFKGSKFHQGRIYLYNNVHKVQCKVINNIYIPKIFYFSKYTGKKTPIMMQVDGYNDSSPYIIKLETDNKQLKEYNYKLEQENKILNQRILKLENLDLKQTLSDNENQTLKEYNFKLEQDNKILFEKLYKINDENNDKAPIKDSLQLFYIFETTINGIYKFGMTKKKFDLERLNQYSGLNKPSKIITIYSVKNGFHEEKMFKHFLKSNNIIILSGSKEFFKYYDDINLLFYKYKCPKNKIENLDIINNA